MENCVATGLDKIWSIIFRSCIVFSQSRENVAKNTNSIYKIFR